MFYKTEYKNRVRLKSVSTPLVRTEISVGTILDTSTNGLPPLTHNVAIWHISNYFFKFMLENTEEIYEENINQCSTLPVGISATDLPHTNTHTS